MQKQIKILLTLLIALALAISCAKNNPQTPEIPINGGVGNRNYRFVADQAILDLDWSDQKKVDYFQTNWINTLKKQTVYTNADLTMIAGMTDYEANYYVLLNYMYHRNKKTRFKFATNITDNGKEYIGAVYYEEAHNYGNLWRLMYVTENGEIQTFSGNGANDPNTVPESWNKNTSFLGYLLVGD